MNRDRLLAVFLLAIGIASFAMAGLAQRDAGMSFASLRLVMFLVAGAICLIGALLFLAGLLPGRSNHQAGAPLFGRGAELQNPGRPGLRRFFLVLPAITVLALLVNGVGPWLAHRSGSGEVAAPSEPKPNEPKDVASGPPAPEPATPPAPPTSPPVAAPAQPPAAPPPELAQPAPLPAQPPAAPPVPAPPPEVVLAPPVSPPEPAPPATVAPLPPAPPPLPTQPEGHRDSVVWLAVAPDGHSIMSASTDHMIKLWDIDGKRLIRNLGVHKDMARTALFMPDGVRALTAGDDGEIVLRQLSDGAVLHVFSSGANGGVRNLAISPDGKLAVSGHDTGTVIVWNIDKGSVLHVLPGHDWSVSAVAVSPDGTHAISGSIDGELKLWDIVSGKQLRSWHGHEQGTYGAVFTADGQNVVTGSGDHTIKLWDLDTFREVRRFEGHSGTVYEIALSADGKRLASVSLDGTARLWNMDTGDQIAEFDPGTGPLYSVAFAADGSLLTGGNDRTIRDWPASGGDGVVLFAGAPE